MPILRLEDINVEADIQRGLDQPKKTKIAEKYHIGHSDPSFCT
jgi:hypothetical protein